MVKANLREMSKKNGKDRFLGRTEPGNPAISLEAIADF